MPPDDSNLPEGANPPHGFVPISHTNPFALNLAPIYECEEGPIFVRGFYVRPEHTNTAGIAHGGVMMTFADIVCARDVIQEIDGMSVTVRLISDFMAPVLVGSWLEGRAEVSRATRSLVFVSCKLSLIFINFLSVEETFYLL